MTNKSTVQSVEKAAVILKLFTKKKPLLTLHEIHQQTGFSKTSALRFCNALCNIGFLERVGDTPHYRLGIELFTIGSIVINSLDLTERAKKYLRKISNELEDNSYLFIERNNKAYCIDAVKGSYYIQDATTNIGDRLDFNKGGGPLAILAHMDPLKQEEIIKLLELNEEEEKRLYARLACIRKQGYSLSSNETNLNTSAVGVPVFNFENKVVAALSVGGIAERFSDERLPVILKVLKEAALSLSRELGWTDGK